MKTFIELLRETIEDEEISALDEKLTEALKQGDKERADKIAEMMGAITLEKYPEFVIKILPYLNKLSETN